MEISINELLKGKGTKIGDKEYRETEAYVTPFLERTSKIPGVEYSIKVELPKQVTITKREDANFDDITYNRVWIQAVLPEEYQVDNHDDVIGMIYGLDVRKPIVKFYRGGLNRACTNLCVFNPSQLAVQDLKAGKESINFNPLSMLIDQASEIRMFLNKLRTTSFLTNDTFKHEKLGMWIDNCINSTYDNGLSKARLSTTTAIDAFKLLFHDAKSPYYVSTNQSETTMFNVYNAFTELISNKDKDIINEVEKVLLLRQIINI